MIENGEMIPVMSNNGIKVMSMGFLIDSQDTPIIWRGPQKSGSIKQFMADTAWGDLDVLIIDNPPGTGDEPLTEEPVSEEVVEGELNDEGANDGA